MTRREAVAYTIPQLVDAFEKAGVALELIAVDNGSTDRTGELIQGFVDQGLPVVLARVEKNIGYGNGILTGLPLCRAPWVGTIQADGQVDPEDVLRMLDVVRNAHGPVLAKARRRFRMDGVWRKIISVGYNGLVWLMWPGIGSVDINGIPKIWSRDLLPLLKLESKRWFLDPELMIKGYYMGVRVIELNVFARMRSNGLSHVRPSTCWDFIVNLLRYRFTGKVSPWRRKEVRAAAKNA